MADSSVGAVALLCGIDGCARLVHDPEAARREPVYVHRCGLHEIASHNHDELIEWGEENAASMVRIAEDQLEVETFPSDADVVRVAAEAGWEIDEFDFCPIQGALIAYSRPVRNGETLLGLPVAGPRVEHEVIERNFCAGDADDAVMEVTCGRARQRVIWEMESDRA